MSDDFVRFDKRDAEAFEIAVSAKQASTDPDSGYDFFLHEFKRNKCEDWTVEVDQNLTATFYWPAFSQKDSGHNRIQRPALSVKYQYPYQFAVVSVNLNRLADERAINPPSDVFSAYQDSAGKDTKGVVVAAVVAAVEKVHAGTKEKFDENRKFAETLPKSDAMPKRASTATVRL